MRRFLFFFCTLAGLASLPAAASAADATATSTGDRMKASVLRMTEYFDTMLPGVLEENNVTLHFRPKFSDLRDEEHIRYPIELRYGATERWELSGGLSPFSPNPLNTGRDHRWGLGEGRLGARYDLGPRWLRFFDDNTLGLEVRIPLGRPPVDINDHYTHVRPYISSARQLRMWPNVTFYHTLSYDRSVELTHRSEPPPEVMRKNIIEVAPGLLYKPGEFGYFAEYRWRHITEELEWHLAHEVRLGSLWDIPKSRTEKWRLPGKWQIEVAYKYNKEEGRSDDHGITARVNWRTTLREVLGAPPAQTVQRRR